ncbi:MAG: 50S ribosomal protein L6 [Phycisphaerales bacterium]|nr:MAG: 50S ribosomal protein L6 [Phycisphaerales bacterium]
MSRIGKKPIEIPAGVKVEQNGTLIRATGPLGTLEMDCHPRIEVEVDQAGGTIVVKNDHPEDRQSKQMHGTMRALLSNLVIGVSRGFEKKIEIYGTGYNVKIQGGNLVLQVGYCSLTELAIPKGVKVDIEVPATRGNDVPARFTLSSIDKHVLGQFAADIRSVRPPEPYQGKGIRYAGEQVRRKVGKAFTSGAV